jgi:hypothetical protein
MSHLIISANIYMTYYVRVSDRYAKLRPVYLDYGTSTTKNVVYTFIYNDTIYYACFIDDIGQMYIDDQFQGRIFLKIRKWFSAEMKPIENYKVENILVFILGKNL